MPLHILSTTNLTHDRVRALLLPLLPGTASAKAAQLLPDTLIDGPGVGLMAERLVMRRLGPDWTLIVTGAAPSVYADGDAATARDLLLEGCILWCCYLLVPQVRLLVPLMEKSEIVARQLDLDWDAARAAFASQANTTLALLRPVVMVPALQMGSPTPTLIDPDAPYLAIAPPSAQRTAW